MLKNSWSPAWVVGHFKARSHSFLNPGHGSMQTTFITGMLRGSEEGMLGLASANQGFSSDITSQWSSDLQKAASLLWALVSPLASGDKWWGRYKNTRNGIDTQAWRWEEGNLHLLNMYSMLHVSHYFVTLFEIDLNLVPFYK